MAHTSHEILKAELDIVNSRIPSKEIVPHPLNPSLRVKRIGTALFESTETGGVVVQEIYSPLTFAMGIEESLGYVQRKALSELALQELKAKISKAKGNIQVGGLYNHYSNPEKLYKVENIAIHTATLEPMVFYTSLYGHKIPWLRTLSEFINLVDHNGKKEPRFQIVNNKKI